MTKKVQFLTRGTGAVCSIPLWGCDCSVCTQVHHGRRRPRTPAGAVLTITCAKTNTTRSILLDAGDMTIPQQYPRHTVSAIVLTHYHPDHAQGLLGLRWHHGAPLPVIGVHDNASPLAKDLHAESGILNFSFVKPFESFDLEGVTFTPVPLHHTMPTLGYVISYNDAHVAYLCDTKGLPPETKRYLKSIHVNSLVLDCTHSPEQSTKGHCNLKEAYDIYQDIRPDAMHLTHIDHDFDVWLESNTIPEPLEIAQDNQELYTFE